MAKEQALWLKGTQGKLQSIWSAPDKITNHYIAVLAHPHPLHQGTMNNKVVTTLSKAFLALNIPSLRFNYPGVMQSEGVYGHGDGEAADFIKISQNLLKERPQAKLIFAGFSFGAYVSLKAANFVPCSYLINIAPSVENFDFLPLMPVKMPYLVVVPEADEVVSAPAALKFFAGLGDNVNVSVFPNSSHFFHGQLVTLKDTVINALQEGLDWSN